MGGITLVPRLSGVGARISADDENAFVLFFFRILFLSSFVSASCVGDRDSLLREQFSFDNVLFACLGSQFHDDENVFLFFFYFTIFIVSLVLFLKVVAVRFVALRNFSIV